MDQLSIERLQQQILSQLSTPRTTRMYASTNTHMNTNMNTSTNTQPTTPPRRNTRSRFYQPPRLNTTIEQDQEAIQQERTHHFIRELMSITREYQSEQREFHRTMNTIISLLDRLLGRRRSEPAASPVQFNGTTYADETETELPPPPRPTPLRRNSYLGRAFQRHRERERERDIETERNRNIQFQPLNTETDDRTENLFISYFFSPLATDNTAPERLTQRQIEQNTHIIVYDASMNETRCPITMEDFAEGEEVLQIAGCGHYFKREALTEWFRRNNQCPVCRHRVLRGGGTRYTTTSATPEINTVLPADEHATPENEVPYVEYNDSDDNVNDGEGDGNGDGDEHTDLREQRNTETHSPSPSTYSMFEDRYTFQLPLLYDTSNNVFFSENNREPIGSERELQQTIQREILNAFQLFRTPRNQL